MPHIRLSYMPLVTYPDVVPDEPVTAAISLAERLGCELHATTFSVEIPAMSSPLGGMLINVAELIQTTEDNSRGHCRRLQDLILQHAGSAVKAECSSRHLPAGVAGDAAANEARYYDFSLLPWARDMLVIQEFAQAVIFASGRPAILIPSSASLDPVHRLAVAWDGSRVAARALADAMMFVDEQTHITVLTVQDEKQLSRQDFGQTLALSLKKRGLRAEAQNVSLDDRSIALALQEAALKAGANMLVMGAFGHSRVRDFILGGATKGVFADLRLPVLLSH